MKKFTIFLILSFTLANSAFADSKAKPQAPKEASFQFGQDISDIMTKAAEDPTKFCSGNGCLDRVPSEDDCADFKDKINEFSCDGNGEYFNPYAILSYNTSKYPKVSNACRIWLLSKAVEGSQRALAEEDFTGRSQVKALLESAQILYFMKRVGADSVVGSYWSMCQVPEKTLELTSQMNNILTANHLSTTDQMFKDLERELLVADTMKSLDRAIKSAPTKAEKNALIAKKKYAEQQIENHKADSYTKEQVRSTALEGFYCQALGPCRLLGGSLSQLKMANGTMSEFKVCTKGGLFFDTSCLNMPPHVLRDFSKKLQGHQEQTVACLENMGGTGSNLKDRYLKHLNTGLSDTGNPRTQVCCGNNGCDAKSKAWGEFSEKDREQFRSGNKMGMATGGATGTLMLSKTAVELPEQEFNFMVFHEMLHRLGLPCHPFHEFRNEEYQNFVPDKNGKCFPDNSDSEYDRDTSIKWVAQDGKCVPDPKMSPDRIECANNMVKQNFRVSDPVYACSMACFSKYTTSKDTAEKEIQAKLVNNCKTFGTSNWPSNDPMLIKGMNNGKEVNLCQAIKGN